MLRRHYIFQALILVMGLVVLYDAVKHNTPLYYICFFLLGLFSVFALASDFPKIKGYKQASEVRTYTPDNLWEYINGAADQFLDYEFQLLQSCDLSKGDFSVSVDIYDMGSSLNAYGIYMNERPLNKETLAFGVESVISPPYQALLLKDSYYVKIDVLEGEINDKNGTPLLKAIALALKGSHSLPNEITILPRKNMKSGSQRYANKAFLGLKELNKCIYADYSDSDKNEFQYFVMNLEQKATKSTWDILKSK